MPVRNVICLMHTGSSQVHISIAHQKHAIVRQAGIIFCCENLDQLQTSGNDSFLHKFLEVIPEILVPMLLLIFNIWECLGSILSEDDC